MKLGTVVFDNKIYNLDYMTIEEMKELETKVRNAQKDSFKEAKSLLKDLNK